MFWSDMIGFQLGVSCRQLTHAHRFPLRHSDRRRRPHERGRWRLSSRRTWLERFDRTADVAASECCGRRDRQWFAVGHIDGSHDPGRPVHRSARRLLDGIPVSESAYGNDPVHPARHSALTDLIPECISNVTLLDAVTQQELDLRIAGIEDPESVLWIGSPGMAASLSRRLMPQKKAVPAFVGIDGDALVVVGSANERSHRQADRLQPSNRVMLLRGPAVREADPVAVLQRLARDAAEERRSARFGALIATGGDTMEAILDLLDVREIEVMQELDPGFPLARAVLDDGRSLLLAMKAGGFGSDDALSRAVERVCGTVPRSRKNSS